MASGLMLLVWLTDIFIVLVFICLIGIQVELGEVSCNFSSEVFYTGLFNTLVVIYRIFLITKLAFLKRNSGPCANWNFKTRLWFLSPFFNCFLSYIVSKQCVASWQTSTALQVCRQLGKPLFGIISCSCSAEGRRAAVPFNQHQRWKLPCVTKAPQTI